MYIGPVTHPTPSPVGTPNDPAPMSAALPLRSAAKDPRAEVIRRLKLMQSRFRPEVAKGLDAVFQFVINGEGGGVWHTIVRNGKSVLKQGKHPKPTVEMEADGEVWQKLLDYEMNRTWAVVTGKLKIRGSMDLAKKFRDIYPDPNRKD